MFFFKNKQPKVPETGNTKELKTSVQLWRVDWTSRYGEYSHNTKQESEVLLQKKHKMY